MSDGYDYARDTVSELGVPGTNDWYVAMNVAFWLSAVSVLIAGICSATLVRRRWAYLGLICAYSAGSVLVASVHAGEGSAHVLGAILAIGAGNAIAVLVGSTSPRCPRWYTASSVGLGVVGFAASGLLIAGPDLLEADLVGVDMVGVVERTAIYTFVGWEIITAVVLRSRASLSPGTP